MWIHRAGWLASGLAVLAVAWGGPLPGLARSSFTAHMGLHMAVVALAAPLVALGVAGGPRDPVRRAPRLFAPLPATVVELVVVWGWHSPALHHLARGGGAALVLEQASFLACGLLLWMAAVGGGGGESAVGGGSRRAQGIVALLLTSMHMTLLGALLALAPRALYEHGGTLAAGGGAALTDQQLGGTLMLLAGGASYLAGGLWLAANLLRDRAVAARSPARRERLAGGASPRSAS